MPMLQGSKIGRSLPGKPFTFNSHQPQSGPRQQAQSAAAAARPQSPHGQQAQRAAAADGAPQSPKAAGAKRRSRRRDQGLQRPRAPTSVQRPQPTTAPSQAARSSVTAGGGRAWFSEHSADQCGALSAAPKEQDKAPHMVEDVLKTKPGPRRTGHTTRRASWRFGRRWLPRPYGFGRRSTRR